MTHMAGEPVAPRYYWKNPSSGKSSAALRTGYQADMLRKYPMGPGANPLTNDHRKRYGGSTTGGGSVGGGM